jgi:hypothetical protein
VSSPSLPPLLRQSRVLIALFLGLRLMLLVVYAPVEGNPGLTTWGDFQHYYNLAALSHPSQGPASLPYRDYWYEFPPIFPILSLTTYALTGENGFPAYAILLGVVMSVCDVGILLLIRRIGTRLYSETTGISLAWVYAILVTPLIFGFWTFEPLVSFSIMFALATWIDRRPTRSAVGVALGTLTKFVPIVLLAAVWRFRPAHDALRFSVIAGGITAFGIGAMIAIGGPFGIASLQAQFSKASYESVWALIDGNYKTGNFGPDSDHFDAAKASQSLGNPAAIPWWVRIGIFGAIGLYVYARTRRFDDRGFVAFSAITITLFFLGSQGWSPQWSVILIPLVLLTFPTPNGIWAILLLTTFSFVEYPLLFSRTMATQGAISGSQLPIFALLVIARTLILCGFVIALYRQLRRPVILTGDEQPLDAL